MMWDKKGRVLHWAMAGILLVLAGFALISFDAEDQAGLKADLAYTYLEGYSFATEKHLDFRSGIIRDEALDLVLELASVGGTYQDTCGDFEGFNLWNEGSTLCLSSAGEIFLNEVKKTSEDRFAKKQISASSYTYSLEGEHLILKSNVPFRTEVGNSYYEIPNHFAIDLEYSFDEYTIVENEAKLLLAKCSNRLDLRHCLDEEKDDRWEYADCLNPTFIEDKRKVAFCVESPSEAKVYDTNFGIFIDVNYELALDFTADLTFPIEDFSMDYDGDLHSVSIPVRQNAQQYAVYLTDFEDLDYVGASGDFIGAQLEGVYFRFVDIHLNEIGLECPVGPLENKAYYCGNELVYYFESDQVLYVGVTVWENGEESNINSFKELILE